MTQAALPPLTGPAEVALPCQDLQPTLDFFLNELGFRVEAIFPADAPAVASLSGHGLHVRLAPGGGDPGRLRIATIGGDGWPGRTLTAPNGTVIELVDPDPPVSLPDLAPAFTLCRASESPPSAAGRAGMLYRDLIPGRLGGRYIASHISIPEGGPLSDWVHFHKIRFQMIFCRRGWVRVAYEDQGEPIVMHPGDFVLQPPRIRHRVLESSAGLEVVEIGCPALHETLADHAMTLPTGRTLPERDFGGQLFLFHVAADGAWTPCPEAGGFEQQATAMGHATRGVAEVRPAALRRR